MNYVETKRTFLHKCQNCGNAFFADNLAKGRVNECPYCGRRLAIQVNLQSSYEDVPDNTEVRIAAETHGWRRLFMAAPWQIRVCVLGVMIGAIEGIPCLFFHGLWSVLLGLLVILPFTLFIAWALLKWKWARILIMIVGGLNIAWLIKVLVSGKDMFGPGELVLQLAQSIMGITIAALLLARPCATWYRSRYVGVVQPPPGKRHPMVFYAVVYMFLVITAQIVLGPFWFGLETIDDATCPLLDAAEIIKNPPIVGNAYIFPEDCSNDPEKALYDTSGMPLTTWQIKGIKNYYKLQLNSGNRVRLIGEGKFDAFILTRQNTPETLSTFSGAYVCCGIVTIRTNLASYGITLGNGMDLESYYERMPVLRKMDNRVAYRRVVQRYEQRKLAKKEAFLQRIQEARKKVSMYKNDINKILEGNVYPGFIHSDVLRVNQKADVKIEKNTERTLDASNTIKELESELTELENESSRLVAKLRVIDNAHEVHKKRLVEEAMTAARRRAEEAEAEARRRAEEEARELESRKQKCVACDGKGSIGCSKCNGYGRLVEKNKIECPKCFGKRQLKAQEKVQCSSCWGSGKIVSTCSRCNGSGKVWNSANRKVDPRETCYNCNGRGQVSRDCRTCQGTGEVDKWVRCPGCGGSGSKLVRGDEYECSECAGKGKFKCDRCGGRGFTYRPKEGGSAGMTNTVDNSNSVVDTNSRGSASPKALATAMGDKGEAEYYAELREKVKNGVKLTEEEQKYYDEKTRRSGRQLAYEQEKQKRTQKRGLHDDEEEEESEAEKEVRKQSEALERERRAAARKRPAGEVSDLREMTELARRGMSKDELTRRYGKERVVQWEKAQASGGVKFGDGQKR